MIIMIVDDNAEMRRLIRNFLPEGHEIVECANGAEAVVNYETRRPDWVTMDIRMPLLDGINATSRIRASFPQARIIMVTEFTNDDLREAARKAGAVDYVLKDDLSQLRQLIAETHNG
jgi:CheY-like chemotaxis protein